MSQENPGIRKRASQAMKCTAKRMGMQTRTGSAIGDVIRGDDEGTVGGNVLRSLEADSPVDTRPEVEERADSVQDGRAHAMSVPRRS
jgi:hypothetical protein